MNDYTKGLLIGCGIIAGLLFFALAAGFGWWLRGAHDRDRVVIEASAPAVRQADQSLILERKPDANASAPMVIPAGAKVERLAQVIVKPKPVPASAPDHPERILGMVDGCPPVTVDLALIRQPDQSRRVIASSPDGVIVGGVDIPVEPVRIIPDPPKWAAGASYSDQRKASIWIDRDLGRLVVGGEVRQSDQGLRGAVRVGWRF